MKAYFNQLVQFAQVDETDKEAAVELGDLYRDFQRELQHQFKRASEAVKRVATRWLEEEVARIYTKPASLKRRRDATLIRRRAESR